MTDSGRFRDFLKAYTGNWFAIMSGSPSVPLAVLTLFVESNIARIGLWLTAAVCIVLSAFFVWRIEHRKLTETQARCAELLGEYPHALRLQKVDVQYERHVHPTEPHKIVEQWVQFVLVWKNCIAKPISYQINALLVDGRSALQNNIIEIISGNAETFFYSASQQREPPAQAADVETFEVTVEATYGQPDVPHTRRTRKTLSVNADLANGRNNFIYKSNIDEPNL